MWYFQNICIRSWAQRAGSLQNVPRTPSANANYVPESNLPEWATKKLPSCERNTHTSGLNDWSSIVGLDNFDICPSCLTKVFGQTPYIDKFVSGRRRPADIAITCDMSQPFIRLAWAVARQRLDFELFKTAASILTSSVPCPGRELKEGRKWTVPGTDFDYCDTCYSVITLMFPTCGRHLISRANTSQPRTCDFVPSKSSRYSTMIDAFSAVETGRVAWSEVDVWLKQRSQFPECGTDTKFTGRWWHRCPEISPSWVACQECYLDAVSGTAFESKFTKTAGPDEDVAKAFSCQIYSQRMRGIYSQACAGNSFSMFVAAALERLSIQESLQTQMSTLTIQIEGKQSLRTALRSSAIRYRGSNFRQDLAGVFDTNVYGNAAIGWYGGEGYATAAKREYEASQLDHEVITLIGERGRLALEWTKWE